MLEDLDRLSKRVTLAQDAGAVIRLLEMIVAYTKGVTSLDVKMRKLQAKLGTLEKDRATGEAA